ncbi:KilA-N domain-containing protein [Vibrio navarrensis]|uniref:KilA-N domain-containing protein n=1 Tax=Vibrio navarrensis TaxID=29495 RepID=UPI00186A3688|nr:KilA-N domain-containing protein [Vibrio navarrensis]MBE4617392.1 hypothetical protein [Vibrio navarrensis]
MNAIVILGHDIRLKDKLFSLNDLHKAAGNKKNHQPANFLRQSTTRELVEEISSSSDLRSTVQSINGKGTWVCKELVYAYAMWISAKFHLQVIRAFDSLVQTQPLTLTSAQKLEIRKAVGRKAHNDGESHKRVYHALYDHFSVSEYGHILQSQFDEAIAFINSLDITPRLPEPQLPIPSMTRVMLVIENGQTVEAKHIPNDAFVVSKSRIANLIAEPGIFTMQEMAQISEAVNKQIVEIAVSASRSISTH